MIITEVLPLRLDQFLFVQIHTDAGISGLGESGAWGHLDASAAAVGTFAAYLKGKDPRRIEHHWQVMHRSGHFRGAAIMGAISAIDIALWDIKGKALGVPAFELMGGRYHDRVRVYGHVKAATADAMVEGCMALKEAGYTAIGHFNPFLDEDPGEAYFKPHARKIEDAVDVVRRVREAVGPDVDLCVEIHRRLTPAEAIVFGRAIEPFRPMFYEDPIRPDGLDSMAAVAAQIGIPIATGERLTGIYDFQALMARGALRYARTCVCLCGGLTGAKKIAALAEANNIEVVPHNPLSPVSLAACLQLDACIPNCAIQEYPSGGAPSFDLPAQNIVTHPHRPKHGFIEISDAPGIGVELTPDAAERFPPSARPIGMRSHVDGSVVDQ
ncbi:MAG: mandelate racemase/muconate lactonizing enzyme family protein [Pseudomonadota bacterium]